MEEYVVRPIGKVRAAEGLFAIEVAEGWRDGLIGIEGFSWLNVFWWAHQLDSPEARAVLTTEKPYRQGPDRLGIFATRSPVRPNPILVTPVPVTGIDVEQGVIETAYIDAEDGSPVLDIKPYHGSTDRVDSWTVPHWCADWPGSVEASADFAWDRVFNF